MKNKTIVIVIVVALAVVAVIYGVMRYRPAVQPGIVTPTGETKTFNVIAKQWEFQPAEIVVNRGDQVRLIITSLDVPHGFAVKEYGIDQKFEAGQTAEVDFLADKPGNFVFYCNVFCGEGHAGMKGILSVK